MERAADLMPALASALSERKRVRFAELLPEAESQEPGVAPMAEPKLELKMKPEFGAS